MKKLMLGGVVSCAILVTSYQASAACKCEPWGWPAHAAFLNAGATVVIAIGSATASLVAELTLIQTTWSQGFLGWTSELTKQTAQLMKFEEGALNVEYARENQLVAAGAVGQYQPAPMQDQTVTAGLLMTEVSQVTRERITDDATTWHKQAQAITTSVAGSNREFIKRHEPYCDALGVASGLCDELAPASLQNADLSVGTLFLPGEGTNPTLSDDERLAGIAFIENVTLPTGQINIADNENALSLHVQQRSDQAALSAAALSLHAILAHRTRRHSL